jgi:MFS family permease
MPSILYLFALTNLVIGTGAFVLSGILKPMSDSLGVSVAAGGQAMTAYAFASAFVAPLVLVALGSWSRKRAIQFALLLFLAGSLVCALSLNLAALLSGRVLMGVGSMFSALTAGVVVAMVPPAMRARALALSFLGISLSYAIGLPLGTWLGFGGCVLRNRAGGTHFAAAPPHQRARCQFFRPGYCAAPPRCATRVAAHIAVFCCHLQRVCLCRPGVAGAVPHACGAAQRDVNAVWCQRCRRHIFRRLGI